VKIQASPHLESLAEWVVGSGLARMSRGVDPANGAPSDDEPLPIFLPPPLLSVGVVRRWHQVRASLVG
jgi:hypothetical protein